MYLNEILLATCDCYLLLEDHQLFLIRNKPLLFFFGGGGGTFLLPCKQMNFSQAALTDIFSPKMAVANNVGFEEIWSQNLSQGIFYSKQKKFEN